MTAYNNSVKTFLYILLFKPLNRIIITNEVIITL